MATLLSSNSFTDSAIDCVIRDKLAFTHTLSAALWTLHVSRSEAMPSRPAAIVPA